jgi:hypothetical protein
MYQPLAVACVRCGRQADLTKVKHLATVTELPEVHNLPHRWVCRDTAACAHREYTAAQQRGLVP